MPEPPTLYRIQGWMKTVITTRGDLQQKLEKAAEDFHLLINEVVEAKRGVSAERRMDIYAAGYVLRLLECMKCDFPGLQAFMGEQLFDLFAKAFIVSLPPQSYSLYHLGERFSQFLRNTEPELPEADELQRALAQLPAEIAAFERVKAELHIAEGTEEKNEFTTRGAFDPLHYLMGEVNIKTSPALRLLQQKFSLHAYLQQLENGEMPEPPMPQTTFVLFTRVNYRVRIAEIEPEAFFFLRACAEGKTVQVAAQTAAAETGSDVKDILANLMVWLPVWLEMGAIFPPTTP